MPTVVEKEQMTMPLAVIGTQEIVIIVLVILVLLVGVKKLPELGRGLAEGITEFRKGMRGKKDEDTADESEQEQPDKK